MVGASGIGFLAGWDEAVSANISKTKPVQHTRASAGKRA
jgi:hypothetical protein